MNDKIEILKRRMGLRGDEKIGLKDVILVFGKSALLSIDHNAYSEGRNVLLICHAQIGTHPRVEWDLHANGLEEQNPETIEFLYEILCKV